MNPQKRERVNQWKFKLYKTDMKKHEFAPVLQLALNERITPEILAMDLRNMKFSALNESSLSDDNGDPELATREAQEEEAYSMYHSALRKQYEGDLEESEELLKDLLEMEFLTQAQPNDDEEDEKTAGPLGPALTLKYLVYKNLATISKEKGDCKASVSFYLEALEIDSSDVMMWYNMGKASLNICNYSLARFCFEEGLKYNPNHWPCIDNVISVMYTLNDYANCLYYIAQALERESYYLKGLVFKDRIYKEDPSLKSFCESYFKKCDSSIHFAEYDKEEADKMIEECMDMREKKRTFYVPKPLPVLALGHPIKEFTWKNLGDSLVNVYDCIANADPCVSYSCKIDLTPFVENKTTLQGISEKPDEPSPLSSLSEHLSSNSVSPSSAGIQNNAEVQPTPTNAEDPNVSEMEIDEVSNVCKASETVQTTLLLPQAVDVQPTDLSIYSDSTSSAKRTKRKRNEFAELSHFISKRRSTRVRNPTIKRPLDNTNYQELLHKFLPSKLIGDGKFDEQDYDSDQLSQDKSSSDHTYGQSADKDKKDSTDPSSSSDLASTEKEEVTEFIEKNQSNGGVIDLLYKYVVQLGAKSNLTWPKGNIDVYCSAFPRLRRHITIPNLFSRSTEVFRIKELAWAFLVYCEFKVDQWYQSTGNSMPFSLKMPSSSSSFPTDKVGDDFHADMEFLVQVTSRYDVLGDEWLNFSARALWLKAKFHSLEGEIDLAVSCMGKLHCVLNDDDEIKHKKITVQNCNVSNLIFAGNVKQQLESLQRCQSLEEVQRLYEHGDYAAVVDLLKLTFNQPRTSRKQSLDGVPERHAQLLLLQNSLMKLERYKECVLWSEVSFNEALQQFMNATKNAEWSETMAQLLSGLDKCAKLDSSYLRELDDTKLVRLTQNLVLIIVIQMENYDFAGDNAALLVVLPWIILYRLILNEEKRARDKPGKSSGTESIATSKTASSSFLADFDLSASMPSSLMLLFTAHECLGRRSWCTACDGLLLLTFIDIMMTELQDTTGKAYLYREDLETGLEQCIYCLYGHPNKRSRAKHLQEHNTKQIPLTWERAVLIFQYFKPNILPEFDSYRTSTISAELENLFRKISALVPPDEDPTALVDGYTAYIEGGTDKCPDRPFGKKVLSIVVKDLYYLLGDFYFKNKEFSKAIRFYLCDICINPDRQDSWAGMALSRSSQLDQKLNSYELRNESTIYRKASSALRCFEHALELDPTTTSLWIEYGSLAYILHSHASRQLKQETFCDEMFDMLKKKKREMVEVAEHCFREANHVEDGGEPEEAWLHHYMLGKISEKEGAGPAVYLDHFQKALAYLHEDFARYPQKILYHNPAELSIEALEVYYRVHASCLKFLWKNENIGLDLATVKFIQECLHAVKKSPFYLFQEKSKTEIIGSSSNAASETEEMTTSKEPLPTTETLSVVESPPSIESPPRVDHNYFENLSKNAKKISEDTRHSRPSTDSLPESQDLIVIKEILDSLVSVVAERFVDEAKEKAGELNAVCDAKEEAKEAECKQNQAKVIVESLAEESVYTTKLCPDQSSKTEEVSEVILSEQEELMACDDSIDEFSKLQLLAKELETKAAVCENHNHNSSKENPSPPAQLPLVEELPISSPENNKDDEVLKSLSSILSSLEAVKNLDAKAAASLQKLEETESTTAVCTTATDEGDANTAACNTMEVDYEESSNTIQNEPVVDSEANNVANESKYVKSMEISTCDINLKAGASDIPDANVEPQCIEADENANKVKKSLETTRKNENNVEHSTSDKEIEQSDHAEEKEISSQNNNDASAISNSKGNLDLPESDKGLDEVENAPLKSQFVNPPPSEEELRKSRAEIAKLVPKCLDAMRECLQRFPQHYKALFRMAHYYCHSTSANKNLQWAREILLAATPANKKYPSMSGLFAERKNTNFFNGIWRAPSNEIDRPGSFGAHMYRSVHLLIEVLMQQKDYNMLVNLTLQLHRTPDLGKKYMRDTDRQFLVRKAYDACVNILRDQMNTLLQEEPPPEESRLICCLLEIYRTWMTLTKASIYIDDSNDLLEESYTMYRMGEVDFQPSVLEQAKNFCQIQLGKTYPERPRRDIAMLEEHSLQPLYSQLDSSKPGSSSKYTGLPDLSSSHVNISVPSASVYNPDAWQKDLAETLMMPVLPCEGRVNSETKSVKPEAKPVTDPGVLIPIDTTFNNSSASTPPVPQNSAASPQMVHVEKPKAENLQACSVAFLPVAPVFPKENVNTSSVFQTPPLLSCQAFECFDVLTSIMQASGYQVAPQMGGMVPPFDPANAFNFKTQGKVQNVQGMYDNFQPKVNTRMGRKRKRGKSQKMKEEGLNLSKKMHTKPIVSATIANSITQLKIDPVVTSDKKHQPDPVQSSPLCLVKPKTSKRVPCYKSSSPTSSKGLDLTKKSAETMTSTQCSVIVSAPESKKFKVKPDQSKEKTVKREKKEKKIVTDMLPDIYDFTDESNLSANLETSRIEKCAKEMLEFMNKNVEDTGQNDQGTSDISISKTEMDSIFHVLEAESDREKNSHFTSQKDDPQMENLSEKNKETNMGVEMGPKCCSEESIINTKMEDNKKEASTDLIPEENINQLSKDSATEFTLFSSKPEDADFDDNKDKKLTLQNLVGECDQTKLEGSKNLSNRNDYEKQNEDTSEPTTEKNVNIEEFDCLNICGTIIDNIENIEDAQDTESNDTIENKADSEDERDFQKVDENSNKDEEMQNKNGEIKRCEEETDKCENKIMEERGAIEDTGKVKNENILTECVNKSQQIDLTNKDSSNVELNDNAQNNENTFISPNNNNLEDLSNEAKVEEEEKIECDLVKYKNNEKEVTEEGKYSGFNSNKVLDKYAESEEVCKLSNEAGDSDEISMPKLEAEPLAECSTTNTREGDIIQFGHNETKNINYSILKKDCVVVIRLKDEGYQKKDYNCSEGGKFEVQDFQDTDDGD